LVSSQSNYDIGNHFWCQQWSHNGTFASVIKNGIILHHKTRGSGERDEVPTFFFLAGWGTRTDSFSAFSSETAAVGTPAATGRGDAAAFKALAEGTIGATTPAAELSLVESRDSASERRRSISSSGSPRTWMAIVPSQSHGVDAFGRCGKKSKSWEEIYPRALGGEK
jgi:hypothetical protein